MRINKSFIDYYRCPDNSANFTLASGMSDESGYFRFGANTLCYGRCSSAYPAKTAQGAVHPMVKDAVIPGATPGLAFNPDEVIENLRREHYVPQRDGKGTAAVSAIVKKGYYALRPILPFAVRYVFQKYYFGGWDKLVFPSWPVDLSVECIAESLMGVLLRAQGVDRIPFIWFWPEGYSSCAIMTHDVEEQRGFDFCLRLMDIDDSANIKASFQIVPEKRYRVSPEVVKTIRDRGFELNVHDLNHDGRLYHDRAEFLRRAQKINRHAGELGARGFRSGALYRNTDWYDAFEFSYDMSVPNVAHLDPQRGGCCTVTPYFIGKILELPVTTTQDYSLFHLLGDYSLTLWKRQIALIMSKNGLASFIIHPDYVIDERAQRTYRELLGYLSELRSEGKIWSTLPREVDRWWRARSQMKLVNQGGKWVIEGAGSERARVAFASLDGDNVRYTIATP